MARILTIDDDPTICQLVSEMARSLGHEPESAVSLRDGLRAGASGAFDVVFLDVHLPDGNGLEMLPRLRDAPSSPEVIIMTGAGDPDGAELSMRNGAWDYIEKPISMQKVSLPLTRALQYREARAVPKLTPSFRFDGVIGRSPKMQACFDLLAQAAQSDANVLITGETGTGKELFAWAIHNNSGRAEGHFAVVDCAALPESLVESVLFGHEKGAFTGAEKAKVGLVKQAEGGTLFLDEVGELPTGVQSAFLRVLQERRFRPVGGEEEIESDFRLVAATNRDLGQMAGSGSFRQDLLFRLQAIAIELPPLREREDDIKPLLFHHANRICDRYGIAPKGFSPEFLTAIEGHEWPGNVRELVNTLERAVATARDEPTLFPTHLPTNIRVELQRAAVSEKPTAHTPEPVRAPRTGTLPKLKDFRDAAIAQAERDYLGALMSACEGNIKSACDVSGLSRARLYALMKKHGLTKRE